MDAPEKWNKKSILHLAHYLVFQHFTDYGEILKMQSNFEEEKFLDIIEINN